MNNLSSGHANTPSAIGAINPMLVKLYNTHGLREGNVMDLAFEDRVELCDDVTKLIEQSQKPADREMASDILIALLRHAEKNLKQALAERFSVMDNVPLRLVLQFVNDEIDVAKPVLKYSNVLNDLDLLYIIQSRDSPFWQAIAERRVLGENVIDALADTKDSLTSHALVHNTAITLTDYATSVIEQLAEDDSHLAEALLSRSELTEDLARKLYDYVGAELKQQIERTFGALSIEMEEATSDVVDEFAKYRNSNYMPTASMLKAADLFLHQGRLTQILMMNTLKRGQISSFIAQFSRYAGLPVAVVVPMLQQKTGQGLAIACRACGIQRHDFLMIFSYTRKMTGQDFLASGDANSALTYYDRVTPEIAKRLMSQAKN